jgi:hypothetical protein
MRKLAIGTKEAGVLVMIIKVLATAEKHQRLD